MGLRHLRHRLRATVEELDDARLLGRFSGLDITPIGEIPTRVPVRLGGEIKRIFIAPRNGVPALEIMVGDGTGSCTAVFTGRRLIGGMTHGRAVVLEGVAHDDHGRHILLNPAYTLLAL